ncbi:unnamed protein product [Brassica oleracea var. botrytis]
MKALKDDIAMLGFVADAECWIPTICPCGGGGENHQRGVSGSEEKVQILRKHVDVMAAEISALKYKLTRPNPTSP